MNEFNSRISKTRCPSQRFGPSEELSELSLRITGDHYKEVKNFEIAPNNSLGYEAGHDQQYPLGIFCQIPREYSGNSQEIDISKMIAYHICHRP